MKRAAAVTALSAAALTGAFVIAAGGADAAAPPTTTGEVTFTAQTTTPLAGDSGTTFVVDSFSWGASVPVAAGGAAGRPEAQTLAVQRPMGPGSASLLSTMAAGRQISRLDLVVRSRPGLRTIDLVAYRLEGCLISDIEQGGEHTGSASETVALTCNSSRVTTTARRPDGSAGAATVGQIGR